MDGKEALFEWQDGPLVDCLKTGEVILVDEISLADDSVLERLNSVLERERTLVIAEKASVINLGPCRFKSGFQVFYKNEFSFEKHLIAYKVNFNLDVPMTVYKVIQAKNWTHSKTRVVL